jgi:hypothetical protein
MTKEFDEEWPTRINVIKTITYETEHIYNQILEDNRSTGNDIEVGLDDIIEMIHHYANDDFSCGWGHKADMNDLIFMDENGEEY